MFMYHYDYDRKAIIQNILNEHDLDIDLPESKIPLYVMDQIYFALAEREEELEDNMRDEEEENGA